MNMLRACTKQKSAYSWCLCTAVHVFPPQRRKCKRISWSSHQLQLTSKRGHWRQQHRSQTGRTRTKFPLARARQARPRWQSWHWKLAITYHATDVDCSFHCQIIDCYDLNEWLTIVGYNRFSPNGNHQKFHTWKIILVPWKRPLR